MIDTVTGIACVAGACTNILSHTALFSSAFNTSCTCDMSGIDGIPVPVSAVIITSISFLYAPVPLTETFALTTHGTDNAVCLYPSTVTLPVLFVSVSFILIL